MWISFAHDQDPNNHGLDSFNGTPIPKWPVYSGGSSITNLTEATDDVFEGYGVNYRFDQALSGLAEAQPDTYRAEALDWVNKHSAELFLF
jgi:hypothetical protein